MASRNLFDIFAREIEISEDEPSDSDTDYVPASVSSSEVESSDSASNLDSDSTEDSSAKDDGSEKIKLFEAKDGKWQDKPFPQGRVPRHNILRVPVHKILNMDHIGDELSMFKAYITEDMVSKVVHYTNLEGHRKMAAQGKKGDDWSDTDAWEIWAVFGILLTCGHLKQNHMDIDVIWSSNYGISIVRCAMGQKRFKDILGALRFDDKTTRSERRAKDKFAAIRELWDQFELSLRRHYSPGPNITIDEQLLPFRGRCPFLQYLPSKPDRYGMKIFWAVDSDNSYPLAGLPYLGKEERKPQVGLAKNVTLNLYRPFFGSNRNITTDNFFTDLGLATELLSNGLTTVGTVRNNKRFLPAEFAGKRKMDKYDSKFAYHPKATLLAYQSKKTKSVALLSTMHGEGLIEADSDKRRPEIVKYYNATKGGVDTFDQMAHRFTCKRKTNRWPLVIFMNMLDAAGIAAFTLWTKKCPSHGDMKRK